MFEFHWTFPKLARRPTRMALPPIGGCLEEAEQTAVRPRPKIHRLPGLLIGAGLAVAALLLRWGLDPWLRESQRLLTLYGAVALSVWVAGWPAATVTSVLGYLLLNYAFTPAGGVPVDDPAAIASALGSWFSCFLIIWFAEQNRRARQLASERKQQMEEHLRRHERLAAIVESSSDAIVSIDLDWKITSWNRGAELLYG